MKPLLVLYNIIQGFVAPVWAAIGPFYYMSKGRKPLHHFKRLGCIDKHFFKSKGNPRLWIHALSVGEVNSIRPLIKAIIKKWPDAAIVLTASTITGIKALEAMDKNLITCIHPSPYDFMPSVVRFVNLIRPECFIIVETDIWPNWLWYLNKKGIPSILVNGSISSKSAKRFSYLKSVAHLLYGNLSEIVMQSDEDRKRIADLGMPLHKIEVIGNLKYDCPIQKVSGKEKATLRNEIGLSQESKVWVAGSTHKGEEEKIFDMHGKLKKTFPELQLLLAPRNPKRSQLLKEMGESYGFRVKKRSEKKKRQTVDVVVLDTLGELLSCYSLGEVAFVGGTLVNIGGHNLLEPASHGIPVIFGPHVESCKDMATALMKCGGGRMITGEEDGTATLKKILGNESKRKKMGEEGKKIILDNAGAVERHISLISDIIKTK